MQNEISNIENLAKEMVANILKKLPFKPVAIIWFGSAVRNQVTKHNGVMLSDIDIMVISRLSFFYMLYNKGAARYLEKEGHECGVTYMMPRQLKKRRDMMMSDLFDSGIVMYGKKNILNKYRFDKIEIPRWEGLRYLFNMTAHLKLYNNQQKQKENQVEFQYILVKCYIAIAKAYAVFQRQYSSDYSELLNMVKNGTIEIPEQIYSNIIYALQFKLNIIEYSYISLSQTRTDLLNSLKCLLSKYLNETSKDWDILLDKLILLFPRNLLRDFWATLRLSKVHCVKIRPVAFFRKTGILFYVASVLRDEMMMNKYELVMRKIMNNTQLNDEQFFVCVCAAAKTQLTMDFMV